MNDKITKEVATRGRDRSTPYPSISLADAIERITKLQNSLGSGPHKRSAVAVGIGYGSLSGASIPKIVALTHYGLLDRQNDELTVSKLAEQIIFEKSQEDKANATQTAAKSPMLYQRLWEKYNGEKLPNLLHNILVTEFNVSPKVSHEVAETFKETMSYAELLNENGILGVNSETRRTENKTTDSTDSDHTSDNLDQKDSPGLTFRRIIEGRGWNVTVNASFKFTKDIKVALRSLEDAMDEVDYEENKEE